MQNRWIEFSHFNIRSLLTGFDLFSELVSGGSFDILGLSETWLNESFPSSGLHIDGYNLIRKDRDGRGGGVGFYIKNNFKYTVLNIGNNNVPLEQLWIGVNIGGRRLCFGALYRPPTLNLNQCVDHLENSLIALLPQYDYVIFGGDFNVDFLLGNKSPGCILFSNLLTKYGLTQCISNATRVTNKSQSLIDLIVASSPEIVDDPKVLKMDRISDHCLVTCNIKSFFKTKPVPFIKTYRDFSHFSYNDFVQDLYAINWDYIYLLEDIDEIINNFNTNIINLFNVHAPTKTCRITKPPAPWLTENLKLMMKLRDKALTKYKKNRTNVNWNDYKSLRNLVNMSVKSEKRAYLQHVFRTDPKHFWRTLKYLNVVSSSNSQPSNFLNESPDMFNNYFVTSIPPFIPNNRDFINNTYVNKSILPAGSELFQFREVAVEEVERILNRMKSNATGVDGINLRMLLFLTPHLSLHLTYIMNKCLRSNHFPTLWKIAYISPIPKNNNPTELSHFRPISILPCMSKILERIMSNQLSSFLNVYNILPATQSGFRRDHSTSTALLSITDDIFRAYDQGRDTCLILLDYSKAFDTLDHSTLYIKLKYFGIGENALKLFQQYFMNRKQRTILNGISSNSLDVTRGIAQGSILGPLIFSLYTADFYKFLNFCSSHQYADDTQLFHSFNPDLVDIAVNNINSDLNVISKISVAHGLILNESKTQMTVFGRRKYGIIANIKLNNVSLEQKRVCKNLGVLMDEDLRFREHVSSIIQKSVFKLKLLYLNKDILDPNIKLTLCNSLVLPHLAYCNVVFWPTLLQKDKDSLQKLQNFCLRFSYSLRKYDHISEYFLQSKWFSIKERFEIQLLKCIYKVVKLEEPSYLFGKLTTGSSVHDRLTRHRGLFCVPRHSTSVFQRSFTYTATRLYNSLPPGIKEAPTLASFGKTIKKYILERRDCF